MMDHNLAAPIVAGLRTARRRLLRDLRDGPVDLMQRDDWDAVAAEDLVQLELAERVPGDPVVIRLARAWRRAA